MYETLNVEIQGISPLLCHNGQLANPLNPFAKALKEVSRKRTKTDADHIEMSRIEFLGGLYTDEDKHPGIPGENIEAAMVAGAKKHKLGQQAKAGIISDGFWRIEYAGPKTPDALWEEKGFVDVRGAKLQGKTTVMRTRPIFRKWKLKFTLQYLPDQLDKKQVVDIVETVGRIIGLGDFKPKFGRFEVVTAK